MVNVEQIAGIAMTVITYSGVAKSCYVEAMRKIKSGNKEEFEAEMKKGDENFVLAHHAHLEILNREMTTAEPQITMLLAHAEDQLMSAETIKTIVIEMESIIKEVRGKNKDE